jgi:hypothetical protein
VSAARDLRELLEVKPCRPVPRDAKLYAEARETVRARVRRWPSAYASAQVVQEYQRRGGTYEPGCERGGLDEWFAEEWVNVCEPDLPPCGRGSKASEREYRRGYPKCRPRAEAQTMTRDEKEAACRRKRRAVAAAGPRVVRVK